MKHDPIATEETAYRRGGPSGTGRAGFVHGAAAWSQIALADADDAVSTGIAIATLPSGDVQAFAADHSGTLRRFTLRDPARSGAALASQDPDGETLRLDLAIALEGRPWSTPVIVEKLVIVGTDADLLYAIDRESGTVRWQRRIGTCDGVHAPGPEGGRCDVDGGPTVTANGDLLVGADGLYRVSTSGDVLWRWPAAPQRASHVGGAPIELADGSLVFAAQGGLVVRLRSSGELLWQLSVRGDIEGGLVGNAALEVFVAGDDGTLRAIDSAGAIKWELPLGAPVHAALAMGPHGDLIAADVKGVVHVVAQDGVERWKVSVGAPIYSAPLVARDGAIFVSARDESLHVLRDEGRRHDIVSLSADADGGVSVDSHGRLWIGTDAGWIHVLSQSGNAIPDRD